MVIHSVGTVIVRFEVLLVKIRLAQIKDSLSIYGLKRIYKLLRRTGSSLETKDGTRSVNVGKIPVTAISQLIDCLLVGRVCGIGTGITEIFIEQLGIGVRKVSSLGSPDRSLVDLVVKSVAVALKSLDSSLVHCVSLFPIVVAVVVQRTGGEHCHP